MGCYYCGLDGHDYLEDRCPQYEADGTVDPQRGEGRADEGDAWACMAHGCHEGAATDGQPCEACGGTGLAPVCDFCGAEYDDRQGCQSDVCCARGLDELDSMLDDARGM